MAASGCGSVVVVVWWTVLAMAGPVSSLGGVITGNVVYNMSASPYVVTEDILVEAGARLTIQPGVTLQFDPGVGMTVRGILHAQVRWHSSWQKCFPFGDLNPAGGGLPPCPSTIYYYLSSKQILTLNLYKDSLLHLFSPPNGI